MQDLVGLGLGNRAGDQVTLLCGIAWKDVVKTVCLLCALCSQQPHTNSADLLAILFQMGNGHQDRRARGMTGWGASRRAFEWGLQKSRLGL